MSRRLRLRLAPDTAERHRIAAGLVGDAATVLDVGGVRGLLAPRLPRASVTTVNVDGSTDARYDGDVLPFVDSSFDAVTSLDVLEHLEPSRRHAHVEELLRVAHGCVICCTPLGTPQHAAAERDLADRLASLTGSIPRFLSEHVALGLPTERELRALPTGPFGSFELLFHGDFRRSISHVELAARVRRGSVPALVRLLAELRAPASLELERAAGTWTNRAFLVWGGASQVSPDALSSEPGSWVGQS